jgi:hypothetical protein
MAWGIGDWGGTRKQQTQKEGKNILEWRSKQQASKGTLLACSWVLGADMYRR